MGLAVGASLALTAASAAVGVVSQRQATAAQQVELDLAARQEADAARGRELQRKRRLAALLGAQYVNAAASGVAMSGSVANIASTDARRAYEDTAMDYVNTQSRLDALRRQRESLGFAGALGQASTILGAAQEGARTVMAAQGGA